MRRFKPKDLRERIAVELARQAGFESAAMIRQHIENADRILDIILQDLEDYLYWDEEGVKEHLKSGTPNPSR